MVKEAELPNTLLVYYPENSKVIGDQEVAYARCLAQDLEKTGQGPVVHYAMPNSYKETMHANVENHYKMRIQHTAKQIAHLLGAHEAAERIVIAQHANPAHANDPASNMAMLVGVTQAEAVRQGRFVEVAGALNHGATPEFNWVLEPGWKTLIHTLPSGEEVHGQVTDALMLHINDPGQAL